MILLGAPGAGKGTQAKRLSAWAGLAHVSTGDLFRENIGNDTELGRKAKGYMDAGQLVPDELVLDMLFDHVAQPACAAGYILDGFPRTLPQAEALTARLAAAPDSPEVRVLDIRVSDDRIVDRIAGRLLCKSCGNIQHKTSAPPAKDGVCDECGGELHQRADDRAEVVQERLAVYHEQTAPLVRYYEEQGLLESVDGERAPDEVFESLTRFVPKKEGV